jgi:Thaumatin family
LNPIVRQLWRQLGLRFSVPCTILMLAMAGSAAAQTHTVTFRNLCAKQIWLAEKAPSVSSDVVPTNWALAPRCSNLPGAPKICASGQSCQAGTCTCATDADCTFGAAAGTVTATCDTTTTPGLCVRSTSLSLAVGWSGRFWPRTGCSGGASNFSCQTGQCGTPPGKIDCTEQGASANLATLFEISSGGTAAVDNYDVSLVSGYNVPIAVKPILPADALIWKPDSTYYGGKDQSVITQRVGVNSFAFNDVAGGTGTSGDTPPAFPAKRFGQVSDGSQITWSNSGPSCEIAGCKADLRLTCPATLRVVNGAGKTIGCNSPANVCLNGGSGCGADASYFACTNYAGAKDLFGNYLNLQSPNAASPICFSAKDCQPGTTCLINPTFTKALNPPLPTGAGICTPVIQADTCTFGGEGTPCSAFPFVDYSCNSLKTSETPVCLPPTTSGPGELVRNAQVWSATATTCTAGGGQCSPGQQCLDSNVVNGGVKDCSATSANCFCNNPDPCSANRGTNDGCTQPDSCLNSDGVPDGKYDGANLVDCTTSTCYCSPQAIYSGTCGASNAKWLQAASFTGLGASRGGYEKIFKRACKSAYAYQFDDPSSDWTCSNTADQLVNYTVTFCPNVPVPLK